MEFHAKKNIMLHCFIKKKIIHRMKLTLEYNIIRLIKLVVKIVQI